MKDSKFIDKFAAFAGRLGNQIHLKTLRDAFATVMPLYILAGLIVLLNNTVFKWIFQGDTLTKIPILGNYNCKRYFKHLRYYYCRNGWLFLSEKQRL